MRDELDAEAVAADDFAYQFALSITVVRHLNSTHSYPPS